MDDVSTFLETLFAPIPDSCFIYVWTMPSKRTTWCRTIEDAARAVDRYKQLENVYVGMSYSSQIFQDENGRAEYARCAAENSAGIPALWAEIDFGSDENEKFANVYEALEFINNLPLKPTMIVSSGHGYHLYWIFREPWVFDDDDERLEAEMLSFRWKETIRAWALRINRRVDSVGDLARVMRVAGTFNYKQDGKTIDAAHCDNPRPVTIEGCDEDIRYDPTDFEPFLAEIEVATFTGELEDFVVDPLATISDARLNALMTLVPEFGEAFHYSRFEHPEWSPSEYDMSMARLAAGMGCTDQEIVNVIIQARRTAHIDIKQHKRYYELTLQKARETNDEERALVSVETVSEESDETKNVLRSLLGVEINWITKYESEPAQYRICVDGKQKLLDGVDKLTSQSKFRQVIAEVGSHNFKNMSAAKWNSVSNILLAMADKNVETLGGDLDELGLLHGWARMYLNEMRPAEYDDRNTALPNGMPYVDSNERICITLTNFVSWLQLTRTANATARKVAAMMAADGWVRITGTWKDESNEEHSQSVWAKPQDMVAVDYLVFGKETVDITKELGW